MHPVRGSIGVKSRNIVVINYVLEYKQSPKHLHPHHFGIFAEKSG